MKVGVYFDLRNPDRWRRDPTELYRSTLDLCVEAERLGIDSVWFTEHHDFDDGYLPQPLTMAAAVAARTERIRIGIGVVIAPLHSAVEIAEQAAIVDIISGGRLELGLGAGYRPTEFELFAADFNGRYDAATEIGARCRDLWENGPITPRPVQDRIPIWYGFQGPIGARRAGRTGEGLLSAYGPNYEIYLGGLREGGHSEQQARMGGLIQAWLTADPDQDWQQVAPHVAYQADSYREHAIRGTDLPTPKPVDPDRLRQREPDRHGAYLLYGTPSDVADRVRQFVSPAPVDTVFFWGTMPGMTNWTVRTHLELLASDLAPRLRD